MDKQSSRKAIIFSAPSGSGKTTIVRHLLSKYDDLGFSISAVTRDRRGRTEVHGKDYYFLSIDEFTKKIDEDAFVEWEEVYPGGYYGTLKSEIQRLWDEGKNVVFDVDVKGGMHLKEFFGEKALSVYVKVPSFEELEKRLRARGTETEDSISKRLYKVKFEMKFQDRFDVILVNDDLKKSLDKAERLYESFNDNDLEIEKKPLEI
jgi:guanylate kinase